MLQSSILAKRRGNDMTSSPTLYGFCTRKKIARSHETAVCTCMYVDVAYYGLLALELMLTRRDYLSIKCVCVCMTNDYMIVYR